MGTGKKLTLVAMLEVVVIILGGYFTWSVPRWIDTVEATQEAITETARKTEIRVAVGESRFDEILRRLERIEKKIDGNR